MSEPDYKKGGLDMDRYIIQKRDGTPIDKDAQYFVMRIDKDPHAASAALSYARSVKQDNPQFSEELQRKVYSFFPQYAVRQITISFREEDNGYVGVSIEADPAVDGDILRQQLAAGPGDMRPPEVSQIEALQAEWLCAIIQCYESASCNYEEGDEHDED